MHPILRRLLKKRNILILCAVILSAFAFWYFKDLQIFYARLEAAFLSVVEYDEGLAALLFTALAALSAVVTFFSSTPVIPAMTDAFGQPVTLILVITGWLIGGSIAYWIFYSLQTFAERFKLFKRAEHYRQALEGRREFWLILLFRLAVPAELGSYALGLLRYPFWKYLVITVLGEFPFAVIAVYSSNAFIDRQPLLFIGLMVAGTIAISVTFYLFYRLLRKVKPEADIQVDEDPEV